MRSKANMRAKGLAKSGLKNLLMHKAHSEEHTLQRGGSVSHRRAQSDCLQNRLPITQHFGMSRPRRPAHKIRTPGDEDMIDTGDTWDGAMSGPVTEPDTEYQKDEEEGEESLLCDPEEMDLLGEIFDTLSSRSPYERGLLYGTRSLDLFGPDSHDYITKHGSVNPSQENLSLSISGSGSLHSWNLETTEEPSDLTEDSDWLCPDTGMPKGTENLLAVYEIREQERGQREDGEKQEEVNVVINGNQGEETDGINNLKEVKLEEETKKEAQEGRVSLEEDNVKEMAEKLEDEGWKKMRKNEQNLTPKGVDEGKLIQTNKMLKGVEKEKVIKEDLGEKNQEVAGSVSKLTKLNPQHPNSVEEQRGQEEALSPETTASPEPQSLDAEPKPPAGQEKGSAEATEREEREIRQTIYPPKVRSVVAHFQSQAGVQGFQAKPRTAALPEPETPCNMFQSRENAQTHPPCDSNMPEENNCSKLHEDEPPPIKVSELKKRFEA